LALSLPWRCPEHVARRFLEERAGWIEAQAGRLPERIPLTFGAVIPVLGETRRIVPAHSAEAVAADSFPVLAVPARCEATVRRILRTQLRRFIEIQAYGHAQRIGTTIHAIRLADPHARWGSCGATGKLMFSWRLVFAPREVLEYVIAHEVAHLREAHHGAEFWALVEELCPLYRAQRHWLKTGGHVLMRYGMPPVRKK
jgi:predicted metal-dependent hydrolase